MKKIGCVLLAISLCFVLCSCTQPAPADYLNTKWTCQAPYMWFVVEEDGWGRKCAGQLEDADGDTIDVTYEFSPGCVLSIYRSDEIEPFYDENGAKSISMGEIIYVGRGELNRDATQMVVETKAEYDTLYGGKYPTLIFTREEAT